jgi:hypothetical protein
MELPHIPQDDLIDVMEMANKLEACIYDILEGNNENLAISALMSATINVTLGQCSTLAEVIFYRNIYMKMFDSATNSIKIKKSDPSS